MCCLGVKLVCMLKNLRVLGPHHCHRPIPTVHRLAGVAGCHASCTAPAKLASGGSTLPRLGEPGVVAEQGLDCQFQLAHPTYTFWEVKPWCDQITTKMSGNPSTPDISAQKIPDPVKCSRGPHLQTSGGRGLVGAPARPPLAGRSGGASSSSPPARAPPAPVMVTS